jgi:hypothetical protein
VAEATGQPTTEQVLAALDWNGVRVSRVDGYHLDADGFLHVQLDADGGVVLPRADWAPSRMCNGGAECVGQNRCPRSAPCTE